MNNGNREIAEMLRNEILTEMVETMQPFVDSIPTYHKMEAFEDFAVQFKNFVIVLMASFIFMVIAGVQGSANQGEVSIPLLAVGLTVFLAGFLRGCALLYASGDGGKMTKLTSWTKITLSPIVNAIISGNITRNQLFTVAMAEHKDRVKVQALELQPKIDEYNEKSPKDEIYISDLGYVKMRLK